MDYDEIVVKESPGLCRCCLSEGCYKDLATEYTWMSETEVYADMLLECFDISISQHPEGPNGPNRLICEVCITRLRDACNFKKQVQDSERKFVDMLARGDFQRIEHKEEPFKSEMLEEIPEELEVEYLEDLDDFDEDDLPLKLASTSQQATTSNADAPKAKGKRGRPKKTDAVPEKKPKVTRPVEEKPKTSKTSKAVKDVKLPKTEEEIATRRRRKNLQTLFDLTSIIPFEWEDAFVCFYCGLQVSSYKELRKHTKYHGRCSRERLTQKVRSKKDIYVDVSEIACEVCEISFDRVNVLTEHLIITHDLKYDRAMFSNINQYKLINLGCTVCDEKFNDFLNLVRHTEIMHPKISFCCLKCTLTFSSKVDLENHIDKIHPEVGSIVSGTSLRNCLICPSCSKVFTSLKGYRRHIANICVSVKAKTEVEVCQQQDILLEKKYNLAALRESIANFLNMSSVLPFKFFMQRFRCYFCSIDFTDFEYLKAHTLNEHTFCDPKGKLMKALKGSYINIKVDITNMCCKICCEPHSNLGSMVEHLVSNHKARFDKDLGNVLQPFKLMKDNMVCLQCPNVSFRYFSKLLEHNNEMHSNNKIICSFCGMSFGKDPNYRSHLKRHHNPTSLKCNDCDKEFDNLSKLTYHRAKLHGEKPYKCPRCLENFSTQYMRQKHLIDVHGTGHPCTYCGKMFTRNSFMENHIRRSHLKEKNVECSVCKERFFDNVLLRMHMVKHVGERNFHCDVCGKSFLWKKNLRGHMSSHK